MDLETYQTKTGETNCYPEQYMEQALFCGLMSEAGEVAGVYKKYLRGDYPEEDLSVKLKSEIGDVFWYLSELCTYYGWSLSEVMEYNVKKLAERKKKGKIKGSGDNR